MSEEQRSRPDPDGAQPPPEPTPVDEAGGPTDIDAVGAADKAPELSGPVQAGSFTGPEADVTPPAPPSPTEPGRFIRVVRWMWSANPVTMTVLSIFSALVVGAILIVIGDQPTRHAFTYFTARPSDALTLGWDKIKSAYINLFEGSIFNPDATGGWSQAMRPISETLTYAAPLILTGLAVAIAFRGGLFNIGAQGQAIFGVIGAGLIGVELNLPPVLFWLVALLGGAISGAIWGLIPGFLKARTGAHEVIVTIMLNYIALSFLGWLITQPGIQIANRQQAISKNLHANSLLPGIFGGQLRANVGLLVGLAMVFVIVWLVNRSTFGFELRAVGANPDAARTAGMSVQKTYILVMVVAGALAGLGGAVQLLGTAQAVSGAVTANVGFDGITVALLGRSKPWGVVLAALLFGALYAGGNAMQSNAGVAVDLVQVLQALIVIFIAAPALIMAIYRLRPGGAGQVTTNLAKGW